MAIGVKPIAVTVNWRRLDDTLQCVRSLLDGNPGLEMVVVDNGSGDDARKVICGEFPNIHFIQNETNEGYAKGVNKGIRRALELGATHVLVVNNDAVGRPGMIGGLLEGFDRNPKAGIVGPKILYYGSDIIWFSGGHFNHWLGYSTHPHMDKVDNGEVQEGRVDFITGCAMMVKAEVFERVGLFNEDFDIYAEDIDFCLRALEQGFESWFIPSAVLEHKVSVSTGVRGSNTMTPFRAYYYGRNMMLMISNCTKGAAFVTCFYGQTLILIPYYFLITSIQGARGSFGKYLKGYFSAVIRLVE